MTQMFFDALENRIGELERYRENSARFAEAFAKFRTKGLGSIEFKKRVNFKVTFIEEPYMSYGCFINTQHLEELFEEAAQAENMDYASKTPPLPLCSGFVTEWDIDKDTNFYVGAWVAVRVWYPPDTIQLPTELGSLVKVFHHFTFKAVAFKNVPTPPDSSN